MASTAENKQHELSVIRETVESVWVAIILAFVLRAFMLEAFVIPTGSMAPRLMGEHYDLKCEACGYEYSYGWDHQGSVKRGDKVTLIGAQCPSCTHAFSSGNEVYVNGGDRVLVLKYLYKVAEPKPFDVVVFRNPQSNANNYIKRLIGLPGETIEIVNGDVFVTQPGGDSPEIRRKPDRAQDVMWQIISDNDYQPDLVKLKEANRAFDKPRRWVPLDASQSDLWTKSPDGRAFTFKGSKTPGYLRFKGVQYSDSNAPAGSSLEEQQDAMREAFIPRYGYNDDRSSALGDSNIGLCYDLKVSAIIKPGDGPGSVECVLDGMWYSYRVVFDSDGTVTVFQSPPAGDDKQWTKWASGKTSPMQAGSGRSIELAHVDHSVKVWIDDEKVIDKNYSITLEALKTRLGKALGNSRRDRLPCPGASIGASGAEMTLTHLKLMRDVYYTTDLTLSIADSDSPSFLTDYAKGHPTIDGGPLMTGATGWGVEGNPITLTKNANNPDLDQFFVLGDNSPKSLDSRGWIEAAPSLRLYDDNGNRQYQLGTVPRYNMIGKAMFVYWPSGHRAPMLPGLPIIPDVGRMRLIH
ncbi:MAG: signal peptidase I [Phycisphaerales bacterium]|nr:signal peptidase I [Phycisphaerales bacterium]